MSERGTTTEVVDTQVQVDNGFTKIDVVVASSIAAPLVDGLAHRLAEHLSSAVQLRLLVVSAETERATVVP